MQEAGVTSTLPLHCTFYCALLLNYTFFYQKVNAQIAIPHIILFQKLSRTGGRDSQTEFPVSFPLTAIPAR